VHPLAALPGLDPDATHFWFDFTIAVSPHASAGTVTQILGAIHWAGHTRGTQRTLPAHLAIEEKTFNRLFHGGHRFFYPAIADFVPQRVQPDKDRLKEII
jgi:hypothetical protein